MQAAAWQQPAPTANSSGQGKGSFVPPEVTGFNFGAFSLNLIWGLANGVTNALLVLVPFFGAAWSFVLGFKGNEWAWQNKRWESVEAFKATQRRWTKAGIIVLAVTTSISVLMVVLILALAANLPVPTPSPTLPAATETIPPLNVDLTKTVTSDDGRFSLRVPDGWTTTDELHEDSELGVGNEDESEFAMILASDIDDMAETLPELADRVSADFAKGIKNGSRSEPSSIAIDGNPAVQYEITGGVNNVNLSYIYTAVTTPENLVEMYSWTTRSNFVSARDRLVSITGSLNAP